MRCATKGCSYTGTESLPEKILETLKDHNSAFNFQAVFKKYRGKFLSYRSPKEIIKDLETLTGRERLDLQWRKENPILVQCPCRT